MIENLFSTLYTSMTQSFGLALFAALAWGILSILLSPCHLSSIPLVIGFVMQQEKKTTGRAFTFSLVFSMGILVSIAFLGLITASLGRLMGDIGHIGNIFVSIVFFLVGFYLLDIIRLDWSLGPRSTKQRGFLSALFLGLIFGVALGPCTFAFIAPVLGVAFAKAQSSFISALLLIFFFAVGHCSVIVFFGTMAQKAQEYLNWTSESKSVQLAKKICGILVIAGGVYLLLKTL
jgi:cytochrome c-type biogenesis protein